MRDAATRTRPAFLLQSGITGLLALSILAAPAAAQPAMPGDEGPEPARPELIAETEALVAGATNAIALTFEIDEDWHVYWPGQNTTGFAPTIDLTLPEGWTAGDVVWPTPHRHVLPGGILDHIYEDGEATFIIPINIPADAPTGPTKISADLEWLVCREACIPGWATVSLEMEVVAQTARPAPSDAAPAFAAARKRTPPPYPQQEAAQKATGVRLAWSGVDDGPGTLEIHAAPTHEGKTVETIAFYPHEAGATIEDLIKAGEQKAKADGTLPPLRLTRTDDTKPVLGILEIVYQGDAEPGLFRIESVPPPSNEPTTSPEG